MRKFAMCALQGSPRQRKHCGTLGQENRWVVWLVSIQAGVTTQTIQGLFPMDPSIETTPCFGIKYELSPLIPGTTACRCIVAGSDRCAVGRSSTVEWPTDCKQRCKAGFVAKNLNLTNVERMVGKNGWQEWLARVVGKSGRQERCLCHADNAG